MTLRIRISLVLAAAAAAPFCAAAGVGALDLSPARASAVAAAAAAALWALLRLVERGMLRPVGRMLAGVRGFLGSEYRLDSAIPRSGWPEMQLLAGDLNRMMLELQAFRAFQLSRIMDEKNKAQALIDAISDGLVLMEENGALIYSNQAAQDILGVAGGGSGAVLPGAITNAPFVREFASILAGSEQFMRSEITAPSRPVAGGISSTLTYRITASRFLLPTLRRRGCAVVLRDATGEKELEKEREAFFRMITHDMRSPLATIQGYADIIKRKVGPASGTEPLFQNMMYSARRLGGMIDDILSVNKLRSGALTPVLTVVSANDLIARISGQQSPVTVPKRITVSCEPSPQDPRFSGDGALLERVLSNIAETAVRGAKAGGVMVFGTEQDEDNVTFWVRNTGPVLSEEIRSALFEEFPRGGGYGGQGLGLAVAKMAVRLHGGRIWAEPDGDRGNKFVFTVPREPEADRSWTGTGLPAGRC